MPELILADGMKVTVAPPAVPALVMGPPAPAGVVVVPVTGPPGPPGPPGDTAGLVYTHTQSLTQSVWQVEHNLGRFPVAWSLYDSDGRECDNYEVQHLDVNSCRVSMDVPTAGLIRFV